MNFGYEVNGSAPGFLVSENHSEVVGWIRNKITALKLLTRKSWHLRILKLQNDVVGPFRRLVLRGWDTLEGVNRAPFRALLHVVKVF
jgi:hypothetical protein